MKKRYWLFAGFDDCPLGGWDDFRGRFDTIEEAASEGARYADWWHVVDVKTCVIVREQP